MRRIYNQEIKDLELKILLEFKKLCEEEDIHYCLCGGTLLGAIRHRGFIPWDDDIDVLVPRTDFEKLVSLSMLQKDKKDRYKLISWKNGKSPYPFIKMVDTNTIVKEEYMTSGHMINVWIDIFPLDGMPANDRKISLKFKEIKFLKYILLASESDSRKGTTWYIRLIKRIVVPLLTYINKEKLCDMLNKIASEHSISTSPYVGGYLWGYGPQEKMPRTFLENIEVEFEGHYFKAPACWDYYLTQLYGDYMQLPPEEKRVHHNFEAWMKEE